MKKTLLIAPLDTKGRYRGGISVYAQTILDNKKLFEDKGIVFTPLNNCIVNRKYGTNGKFSFPNIWNFLKAKKAIKKALKQQDFDTIYINTSFGISLLKDLYTLNKKIKRNYRVVLHIHFADIDRILTKNKLLRHLILKNLKSRVTHIVSLSSVLKTQLVDCGFDAKNISVLYNYFDPNLFTTNSEFILNKYKGAERPITNFLFVGSLDKRKGFYDLVTAFQELNPEKSKLIICGNPNDENAKKVLDRAISNPIFKYCGYVAGNEKSKIFSQSDVLVLPSYGEGLPITILEALHFGMPIITTKVGAIPEIINENFGTLLLPGDTADLKNSIMYYSGLSNSDLKAISLRCITESEKYSFSIFASKLVEIIATAKGVNS